MIFDTKSLDAVIIERNEPRTFNNNVVIGSGGELAGWVQDRLEKLYSRKFNKRNKDEFLKTILNCFCDLGRNDPKTGHPAVFYLEGYILEKRKLPRSVTIKLNKDITNLKNYCTEIKEDD